MNLLLTVTLVAVALQSCRHASLRELQPYETERGWGYRDECGDMVIRPHFLDAHPFSEGLAAVCVWAETEGTSGKIEKKRRWGYIDATGNFAIPPRYVWAWSFKNGVATVGVPLAKLWSKYYCSKHASVPE